MQIVLQDGNAPAVDTPTMLPMGQAAQWYRLVARWNVIPVYGIDPVTLSCTCGHPGCRTAGKHPIGKAFRDGKWDRCQHELVEPTTLLAWWQRGIRGRRWRAEQSGVAVITGAVSGLVVLDVDGPEGEASLAGRELPVTPTVETGSGGRHYYFAHPGGVVPNKVRISPGLDVRGDGGYVVAPPSRHRSGRVYRWLEGRRPDEVPLAPMPAWLVDMIRGAGGGAGTRTALVAGQGPKGNGSQDVTPLEVWVRLLVNGVEEGRRNDTAAKLAGYLLAHRLPPAVVGAILLHWNQVNRPPLREEELLRVVRSISARDARRRGVTS